MTPTTMCPPSLPVCESAGVADSRIVQLAADHQAATVAVRAPDVAADLAEAAADTARVLGLNPTDPRVAAVLLRLATRSYAHGHMDASQAAREQAAIPLARLLDPTGRT